MRSVVVVGLCYVDHAQVERIIPQFRLVNESKVGDLAITLISIQLLPKSDS